MALPRLLAVGASAAVAGLILAASGWALFHPAQPTAGSTLVGRQAPGLALRTIDGTVLVLSQYRGTPVVLNFWASWCVPCRQEAPVLGAAAGRYSGRVQFLGANFQDTEGNARAYEAEVKDPYPVGPIVAGSYLDFGVSAPPETFFIDRQGIVVSKYIGPLSDQILDVRLQQLRP